MVSQCWTGYAIVDDVGGDAGHKVRCGAKASWMQLSNGREALVLQVFGWRRNQSMAACRFYERYGLVLGSHDRYLYRALNPGTREVALYWYLCFDG